MRCSCAKARMLETDLADRGKATASGRRAANHLSPENFSQKSGSVRSSPAGKTLFSRASKRGSWVMKADRGEGTRSRLAPQVFRPHDESFGREIFRGDERAGILGFLGRHLHQDAAGRQ